jgi:protein-disulfide isomerase
MQGTILYKQYFYSATPNGVDGVRKAPPNTVFDVKGEQIHGSQDASVVLIEFSDYECPFCQRHAGTVGKRLEEAFVSTGKVRHVFVNNPLTIHPNAKLLATAALCAGKQHQYWEMHDSLFAVLPKDKAGIISLAEKLGLDSDAFSDCLGGDSSTEEAIARDMKASQEFNLKGTPAFGIGQFGSDGRVLLSEFIVGAMPFDIFAKSLNEALAKSRQRKNS